MRSRAGGLGAEARRAVLVTGMVLAAPGLIVIGLVSPRRARYAARRVVLTLGRTVGVTFRVTGAAAPNSGAGAVVVANHSSPLDIPAMVVACPDAALVMAADILPAPARRVLRRCFGVVVVDRANPGAGVRALSDRAGPLDGDVVIFPEGGIAPVGRRLGFKTGAFVLAIQTGRPIVPVAIHGTAACLPPKSHLHLATGVVRVEFLAPIAGAGLELSDRKELRNRAHQLILDALGPEDGGTSSSVSFIQDADGAEPLGVSTSRRPVMVHPRGETP